MTFVREGRVSAVDYQAWIEQQREGRRERRRAHPNGTDLSLDGARHLLEPRTASPFRRTPPFTVSITNQDSGHRAQLLDLRQLLREDRPSTSRPEDHRALESETLERRCAAAGASYYFQCDVHGPAMSGAFIVHMSAPMEDADMAVTDSSLQRACAGTGTGTAARLADHGQPQADRDPLHLHHSSSFCWAGCWRCSCGWNRRAPGRSSFQPTVQPDLHIHRTTMIFLWIIALRRASGTIWSR